MKDTQRIFATILCAAMLLCAAGCATEEAAPLTVATIDSDTALAMYASARDAISSTANLQLTTSFSQQRVVGGDTYTKTYTGTAAFTNLGSDNMTALVEQTLTFGTFTASYQEFYQGGYAYVATMDSTFSGEMSAEVFVTRHLPAVLLYPELYGSTAATVENDLITLTFAVPSALESWVPDSAGAKLTSASGTVILDTSGKLIRSTYTAQYIRDDVPYALAVTVEPAVLAAAVQLPAIPEDCTELAYFDAPRMMLQAAGNVYCAKTIAATYCDTIQSQVFSTIRSQKSQYELSGSGDSFAAQISHTVTVTDYTNTPAVTSQILAFQDGVATSSVNGGEPQTQPDLTAEKMRIHCEDAILASMITPNLMAEASSTEAGGILRIRFTGNEAFAKKIAGNVYAVFQADLDGYATSYTTENAEGYLCIDLKTGLPISMGILFSRTHTIGDVPYILRYQYDQTLQLSVSEA